MNKERKYKIIRCLGLITFTVVFYFVYYLIFNNVKDIWTSVIMGIAAVPFNMIVTGVLINNILNRREKYREKKQINMLVGIFYNEIGLNVLKEFVEADKCVYKIRDICIIKKNFKDKEYDNIEKVLEKNEFCIDIELVDLNKLRNDLNEKSDIIINLVSNPLLKDKEIFTEAVLSVLHIRDELNHRLINGSLKEKYENEHVKEDIDRCYRYLALRWVRYMEHLGEYYPYLFTRALINSPFDNRDLKTKDEEYLKK